MTDRALRRFEALFGPEFGHGRALGAQRIQSALARLGAPHERLAPVIHVAGANGKGSTIAFMRAIAEAAGLGVHAFTKPHLLRLNERFVVAGEIAAEERLIEAAERIAATAPDLTQFEAQFAAACVLFSESDADLVLIETGMGGREDATNVIAHPALSVITPIGFDHVEEIGPALSDIARHKAGILKPGAPGVVARQESEALAVIEEEAARLGAPLLRQGMEWECCASAGRLVVHTETRALDLPAPSLYGAHQFDNAGLGAVALMTWGEARISEAAIAAGVRAARWRARLEPITSGALAAPILAAGAELWLDGAHNPHAAHALAHALAALDRRAPRPLAFIVGMRARKDAAGFIRALAPGAALFVAVPLPEDGAAPDTLAALAAASGVRAETSPSLESAVARALHLGAPRIVICGSLALAAEALAQG